MSDRNEPKGWPMWAFFLIGLTLSAVVQSSVTHSRVGGLRNDVWALERKIAALTRSIEEHR